MQSPWVALAAVRYRCSSASEPQCQPVLDLTLLIYLAHQHRLCRIYHCTNVRSLSEIRSAIQIQQQTQAAWPVPSRPCHAAWPHALPMLNRCSIRRNKAFCDLFPGGAVVGGGGGVSQCLFCLPLKFLFQLQGSQVALQTSCVDIFNFLGLGHKMNLNSELPNAIFCERT